MMVVKTFGIVEVLVVEKNELMGITVPRVEVNWSSVGNVPVAKAEAVLKNFEDAIAFARDERTRLGVQ